MLVQDFQLVLSILASFYIVITHQHYFIQKQCSVYKIIIIHKTDEVKIKLEGKFCCFGGEKGTKYREHWIQIEYVFREDLEPWEPI